MKRLAIIGGLVIAALAVGVYRAKLGAEETTARIESSEADVRKVSEEIAVLKAEEAYLSRPERIGPMAREKLGLEPSTPGQFVAPEALSQRLGEEQLRLPAAPAPVLDVQPPKPKAKPAAAPATAATQPKDAPAQ